VQVDRQTLRIICTEVCSADHIPWSEIAMDSVVSDSKRVNCQLHEDILTPQSEASTDCVGPCLIEATRRPGAGQMSCRRCIGQGSWGSAFRPVIPDTCTLSITSHLPPSRASGQRTFRAGLFARPGSLTSPMVTDDDLGEFTKWHRLSLLMKWDLTRPQVPVLDNKSVY
jgi:hypothetical protein